MWDALDTHIQPTYPITSAIEWHTHVEKYFTEVYEEYIGTVQIGSDDLHCDRLIDWMMTEYFDWVPRVNIKDIGYRNW